VSEPRATPATVLTGVGAACIVLGGLVAAVSRPLDLALGSWTAAYLVLVAGVAQYAMGRARARTRGPHTALRMPWAWAQVGAWNVGNALVIGGSLAGIPWLVDVGSVLLLVALVIAFRATRPASRPRWVEWAYRVFLVLLAVSAVIGSVIAHLLA
jgi:multisubunit Na+/H+ antiporter MnhG subunit